MKNKNFLMHTMVNEHKNESNILDEFTQSFDNPFIKTIGRKIAKFLWGTKDRLAWFIIIMFFVFSIVLSGVIFWYSKVQPTLNNLSSLSAKVAAIEDKQQKRDSLLLVMHYDIKDGFKGIHKRFDSIDNRFNNIDADFGTLIHYVSKSKSDEEYLRREILDDHKNLK